MGVNVDKMVRSGDWRRNVLLEPNDIVYIPPTPLAWVGLRVRELMFPVAPVTQAYRSPVEFMEVKDRYDEKDEDQDDGGFRVTPAFP
jgi:hypothetical protein